MSPRKPLDRALFAKTKTVGVRLTAQEFAELTKAAEHETQRRRAIVHEATLLRELAMPPLRELLRQVA